MGGCIGVKADKKLMQINSMQAELQVNTSFQLLLSYNSACKSLEPLAPDQQPTPWPVTQSPLLGLWPLPITLKLTLAENIWITKAEGQEKDHGSQVCF